MTTADSKSVKIHLPLDTEDGNESVSYSTKAICSPPLKELESLNNASILR